MDIRSAAGNMFSTALVAGMLIAFFARAAHAQPDTADGQPDLSSMIMNTSIFGLIFTDQNNGWMVGKNGTIVHTANGGKNWSMQKSGVNFHLYAVSFCDSANGWTVGEHGMILHTSNGGASWEQQKSGVSGNLRAVQCLDARTSWATGHDGALLKTTDGGQTWVHQEGVHRLLASLNRRFLPSFFGLAFSDGQKGFVVGHPGIILRTTDGGANWQLQNSGTDAILYSIAARGDSDAWISGSAGVILRTADGGATWALQKSGVNFMLNKIVIPDAKKGFAVGHQCILHTENGGESWSKFEIGLSRWLYDINIIDAQTGWAVGDSGTIYHTEDNGRNWNLVTAQLQ